MRKGKCDLVLVPVKWNGSTTVMTRPGISRPPHQYVQKVASTVPEPTHLQKAIPATRAHGHPIGADAETADPVLMTRQDTHPFSLQDIPHIAIVIVVPGKEQPSRNGEPNRGHTTEDIVVRVDVQFAIGSEIEQTTRRIVGTGTNGLAVWEKPVQIRWQASQSRDEAKTRSHCMLTARR